MTEALLHAYTPLLLWTGLGLLLCGFLPPSFARLLGRVLYWVGVPLQILALARHMDFSIQVGLAPGVVMLALGLACCLAWLGLQANRCLASETESLVLYDRSHRGSFVLASILGNTGFVGLAMVPSLVNGAALTWAVLYSIINNVLGTYGLGVFIASYYGRPSGGHHWWLQIRDVLTVPSLWAFVLGISTQAIVFPDGIEKGLNIGLAIVIAGALLLMGLRLRQLRGVQSFRVALMPVVLKIVVLPVLIGLILTLLGIESQTRLAVVLMAGMPCAFANLILAEEYDLDREIVASSVVLSTIGILGTIPLWLFLFS
ncbi:transporter [Leptolyngbya sp. 'hensonii']|uniref:AEC family transporter n=1 Tax=Leptolyngbya sp. 'hensonii' TaxID=1922337 RepID=UPI00094FC0AD|nr:AEC family transporter [Leptolyngbya sp. 'hensonii']OLP19232.1 transporter [Leptolyngbya sp. 'hensonii']